jgi:hypothetical protein
MLRKTSCALLGLYYSGHQSQQSFYFFHFTHSLHVSAGTGLLQVNIIVSYEASYTFLTESLLRLSLHIYYLLFNRVYVLLSLYIH